MSLLGSAGDTALRNLTRMEGAPVIAGLTWGELDRLVDEDPIALRDRAWEEIQQLRAENQRLRADLVNGAEEVKVSPAAQLIAALNVDTEQTYVDNGQLRGENERLLGIARRATMVAGGAIPPLFGGPGPRQAAVTARYILGEESGS